MLSRRVRSLSPSTTMAIEAQAKQMRAEGNDIVSFGLGEPDFDTPESIKEAAIRALRDGFTKYTQAGGIDELKEAVVAKLKRDNGLEYSREEVVISCGSKHSLYNLAMVLFERGDEVIIPSPYWVTYPEQVKLCEATPVILPLQEEEGFKLRREDLERVVTRRTKALILNSPSNPTGVVLERDDLEAIADLVVERGFYVISDEAYEALIYEGKTHVSIASLGEAIKRWTILINSLSKAYAMTGWRIGYAVGPREIIKAIVDLQSQTTSNPTSIAQKAAIAALLGSQESIKQMREEFDRRRRFIVERLKAIPSIHCVEPLGAFYVFPNISAYFGRRFRGRVVHGSTDLAAYLLEEAKVAVVPGLDFGSDDHVRLSYAISIEQIAKGLDRMEGALRKLS